MTTDPRIKAAFQGYLCKHQPHEHDKCEGAETSRSAFYPQQMTNVDRENLVSRKVH